ncbi:uncharacterized protein MKK02DRAFT_40733 [Dioszegia hungarica]|uniref:Uncharacterized protein n=1 Tax=Dioszegia hungarica TaxID=4972 RepID=A0AA38LQX6_9TREE|nr:uncharacterized protein MKK02DRAFT_40733 [Dioszegia hungarica]KAI9632430.1 hypothetical protein MKK02DRAFT_40733 [Dioszegia hungarica]
MVFQLNDFTDSEESDSERPPTSTTTTPRRGNAATAAAASSSRAKGRATPSSPVTASASASASRASASPRSAHARGPSGSTTASTGHPLRITLRPSVLQPPTETSSAGPSRPHAPTATSQRSSLSPPPPITLKLSRQSLAEKADYSSSEDEPDLDMDIASIPYVEEEYLERDASYRSGGSKAKKPAKRAKVAHGVGAGGGGKKPSSASASAAASSAGAGAGAGASMPGPSTGTGGVSLKIPGQRKTYDWLVPSSVSASHSGPPDRASETSSVPSPRPGAAEDHVERGKLVEEAPMTAPVKKHSKRRAVADGPGPGKNWRKGQKKGLAGLKAESQLEPGSQEGSPSLAGMASVGGTPEPLDLPRADSPPFERADAAKLGFPVFLNPIVGPKFALGTFPRITQFFAPPNGGDTGPFPRKEKVRTWKRGASTLRGIGGGTLHYKTWNRGPPSELGRLIQADRDAKEIQRAAKKAGNAASAASASAAASSAPLFSDSALPAGAGAVRPKLDQAISSESVLQLTPTQTQTQGDDDSEMGDRDGEEGSVSGVAASPAGASAGAATGAAAKGKKRAAAGSAAGSAAAGAGGVKPVKPKPKPRKSKLGQEIKPSVGAEAE